jgi:hypothetical protein
LYWFADYDALNRFLGGFTRFSEDCQLLNTDWESIGEWFDRRAAEKGLVGWDKYNHFETFTFPANPEMDRIAGEFGANLAASLDKLFEDL